ncbi:MAG TPA: DUF433 domain-containing protein [Vicinamibacteria bacterium]|nr:DUF433 domain-containing protein [Vicinamibacteria bacterium]
MNKEYVEKRGDGYWIAGTRISLDSIVYAFRRGASPEGIQRSFPLLSLEQIYGAITFYLAHQAELNAFLKQGEAEFEQIRQKTRQANPELYDKLDEARKRLPTTER